MQMAEWVPIAGDLGYQGSVLQMHLSLNQELCRILPNVPLIGNVELSDYWFQTGAYTDPLNGPDMRSAAGQAYLYVGPGLRLFICDKIDFGGSVAVPLETQHWGDETRVDFRMRF